MRALDREGNMHPARSVMSGDEAPHRFERARVAVLEQQQHRAMPGVERDETISGDHGRRIEERLVELRRGRKIDAVQRGLENALNGRDHRRVAIIRMPCLVRSVTSGWGSTRCPGTSTRRHCCAIVATTSTSSIHANESPMQRRGPPPNGKYANGGTAARNSGVQRS